MDSDLLAVCAITPLLSLSYSVFLLSRAHSFPSPSSSVTHPKIFSFVSQTATPSGFDGHCTHHVRGTNRRSALAHHLYCGEHQAIFARTDSRAGIISAIDICLAVLSPGLTLLCCW
eukprot:1846373-Rhodomonas_salina.3